MKLTLRQRALLTLLPLLAILAVLGGAGFILLSRLGSRAGEILRENYDSVLYMERLGEAVERIDSSFVFALVGREKEARKQYEANWKRFQLNLEKEHGNITLPGERELADRLAELGEAYRREGDAFYRHPAGPDRQRLYFGGGSGPGLLQRFGEIKSVSGDILRLNQEHMEHASRATMRTAEVSLLWFGSGLVIAVVLTVLVTLRATRALVRPIQAVTESALAIGAGNLDQVVPVFPTKELGQLAGAFNTMARLLRDYRQSQQARLLRLQQTNQATVDAFPHPVLVIDAHGRVETANPAARRLLGAPDGTDQSPVPWQPPEPLRGPLAEALRGERDYLPEGFDQIIALGSGAAERVFLPRALTIRDPHGQALGAAVLLEDVTRFRLLDQVKSNLVATVSHELKTPLTGIRLAVHLLLEEAVGPLTAKQTELLLDARDNAERLLAMIENLLDLARLESKGQLLDLHPERPEELLRQAADAVRPRAEDEGVEVRVEVPPGLPDVAADAGRLRHALGNLLDNALRYAGRGGRVTLSASPTDGAVTLAVSDTGPGIPPEHLPHVFDRFFRVPGQGREGGTGLGLAIVREVAAAHGGTATCASHPGEGTTFGLTLPVWTDAAGSG